MTNISELKATPGPWQLGRERIILTTGAQQPITQVIRTNGETEEAQANANLIAAAPCMFEALEQIELLSTNYGGWFEQDPWKWGQMMGDAARAVLAKARGEQS